MEALVSGQAGLAIVLSDPPEFRPVGAAPYKAIEADIEAALGAFQDVEQVSFADGDVDRLDSAVAKSWAQDRALYRLYMLFDTRVASETFEIRVAGEIGALVDSYGIAQALTDWLSGVELGADRRARALALAIRYPVLTPYMDALFPGLAAQLAEDRAKRDRYFVKLAAATKRPSGAGRRGPTGRSSLYRSLSLRRKHGRTDSVPQRHARALLGPMLEAAALRLAEASQEDLNLARYLPLRALNKAVDQVLAELGAALRGAGIADKVQPYSRLEIRQLLRIEIKRTSRTGGNVRTPATSKQA